LNNLQTVTDPKDFNLRLESDPVLKQRAEDWNFSTDQNAEEVESKMIQLMKTFNGIGLAANQVGLLKRVFVIKLKDNNTPFAVFNPTVLSESSDLQDGEEGCLSFPDLFLGVKRPKEIEVNYLDKLGNECKIKLSGIDARCFLHELDHLNGVVFTEKVSQMKLMLARKKQRKRKW
jgi:peptide deformylase